MAEADTAPNDKAAEPATRRTREVNDPKAMRALAHPVRLALLDAMRDEGELTATRAAELLNDSPGNMSWHLQTLAKYGFIEEAGAKGRSRPWKIAAATTNFTTNDAEPGTLAAAEHLVTTMLDRSYEQLMDWWAQHQDLGQDWFEATFITEGTTYLTVDELAAMREQVTGLLRPYDDRLDPANRPADARAVHLTAFAHQLVQKGDS